MSTLLLLAKEVEDEPPSIWSVPTALRRSSNSFFVKVLAGEPSCGWHAGSNRLRNSSCSSLVRVVLSTLMQPCCGGCCWVVDMLIVDDGIGKDSGLFYGWS